MRAWHNEYRYRVVEVMTVWGGEDQHIEAWAIHEFKTLKAARACEERLMKKGKSVLFQTAKVTWMTPEEYEEEGKTLPKFME
jgi:hypothetical protein